jgi:hypothetical protein
MQASPAGRDTRAEAKMQKPPRARLAPITTRQKVVLALIVVVIVIYVLALVGAHKI